MEHNKGIIAATKAINKKNERIIAAKACVGGTHFFLKDIVEKGQCFVCLLCWVFSVLWCAIYRAAWVHGNNNNERASRTRPCLFGVLVPRSMGY